MADFDDYEYCVKFRDRDGNTVRIAVSKIGGGTVGQIYEGDWEYLFVGPELTQSGNDLHTGSPKTHDQAAWIVFDFLAVQGDALDA